MGTTAVISPWYVKKVPGNVTLTTYWSCRPLVIGQSHNARLKSNSSSGIIDNHHGLGHGGRSPSRTPGRQGRWEMSTAKAAYRCHAALAGNFLMFKTTQKQTLRGQLVCLNIQQVSNKQGQLGAPAAKVWNPSKIHSEQSKADPRPPNLSVCIAGHCCPCNRVVADENIFDHSIQV